MAPLLGDLRTRLQGPRSDELPPRANVSIGTPAHTNPMGPLPPEIRREIFLTAFGNRTLHLDLALQHPPLNVPVLSRPSHANVRRTAHRNVLAPRRWEWWGCECHNAPRRTWDVPAVEGSWRTQPANDRCREGADLYCASFGDSPGCCGVGVLGWLLSCRAAYLEAIDIIYGTNTFHISRKEVFVDLPKLFMPDRLAAITEAELLWDVDPHRLYNPKKHSRAERMSREDLLLSVADTFPNLRRLYISFEQLRRSKPRRCAAQTWYRAVDRLLEFVDLGVARCRHLEECRVALPTMAYARWKCVEAGDRGALGDGEDGVVAVWWPVVAEGRWWAGLVREEGGGDVGGYWVCHGKMDPDVEKFKDGPYWHRKRPRGVGEN